MESNLLINGNWLSSGEIGEPDLSEYHIDKYNGFNRNGLPGDRQKSWYSGQGAKFVGSNLDDLSSGVVVHVGGDYRMAASYLTNTLGAVQERLTPTISHNNQDYESFGNLPTTGVLHQNGYRYFYPQHIEWLTQDGTILEKRERIKKAIVKFGAVASAQKMIDQPVGYDKAGVEIHVNLDNGKLNHAISLIGWDDNLQFKDMKGAWIVKDSNHINEKTGDHISHFYLMYDDFHAGKDPFMGGVVFREVSFRDQSIKHQIYSHSLHGWRYETDENFYEIANKYFAHNRERLKAIGIYTVKKNTSFRINIYKKGTIIHYQNGHEKWPGFHYIKLVKEFELKKGEEFLVSLSYQNAGYAYDASFKMDVLLGALPPIEAPVIVFSKAQPGQSYYKKDQTDAWNDFSNYISKHNKQKEIEHSRMNKTANFAINAYTSQAYTPMHNNDPND